MNFALAHLSLAVALASADGSPASEIVIVPDGEFASHDGRPGSLEGVTAKAWRLTAANAAKLIAMSARIGRDVQVDYDHASEDPALKGAGNAPASGWIKSLRYQAGKGVLAAIDWTADAAKKIAAHEYRFLSPIFYFDKKTGDVLALKSVALTNDPAMNLPAMAQLSAEHAALLSREFDSDYSQNSTLSKGDTMTTINKAAVCAAVGISLDSDDNSVIAGIAAVRV